MKVALLTSAAPEFYQGLSFSEKRSFLYKRSLFLISFGEYFFGSGIRKQ